MNSEDRSTCKADLPIPSKPKRLPRLCTLEDIPTLDKQYLQGWDKGKVTLPLPKKEDLVVDEFRLSCIPHCY